MIARGNPPPKKSPPLPPVKYTDGGVRATRARYRYTYIVEKRLHPVGRGDRYTLIIARGGGARALLDFINPNCRRRRQ